MAPPDLNSLPPSRSMSSSPMQPRSISTATSPPNRNETPSPRASSISLASAAMANAANESSRRSSTSNRGSPRLGRMPSDRRRSQVALSLNLNDPSLPSPGELSSNDPRLNLNHSFVSASPPTIGGRSAIATGDPHHQRQPSLGEIHNELEQEQEAQVNRMLQMIREQQLQLDALRNTQSDGHHHHHHQHSRRSSQLNSALTASSTAVLDDETPASERSISFSSIHPAVPPNPQAPTRRISRDPSSASRSPALRALPGHESSLGSLGTSTDWPPSPIESARRNSFRDESVFYQAETAMLTRENQLLRQRIRELEKQIAEMGTLPANTPATPSNLAMNPSVAAQEEASAAAAVTRITAEPDKL
ncbi:hypothetical protein LTR99_003689 [Exophiala xenobiotica]|uniref:Uncharacterized protein n=1 Tax=Vermiconidia calcicola TaxID=1690605 RepID=A0AAV9PX98_9PEZI|nr:hypothetical protein H2202_007416 [Exophiala xenobiotica]KAK5531382.1 hypothetical protein LTR25_008491 [Vermiconidia calcicola]KAK5544830.1 hypothetical protein LTR23_004270 [Chaetothyriales sp. CCFEE 6169]KAK5191485.1 hypothetical protein LTR92_008656 [Exophiala xenobiotica]KAK5207169.1 hypothetical protein LTR41_007236 [Exophiala xenobiotica]